MYQVNVRAGGWESGFERTFDRGHRTRVEVPGGGAGGEHACLHGIDNVVETFDLLLGREVGSLRFGRVRVELLCGHDICYNGGELVLRPNEGEGVYMRLLLR